MRRLLLALVLGVLLPTLGFAGFAVFRFAEAERTRIEARAVQIAGEATASLDRAFANMLGGANLIARSDALLAGDLAAFHARALAAREALGFNNVGLRDRSSRQILNTNIPWGDPLPNASRLARADARAAEMGQPVFSSVFTGLSDGILQFSVVIPLPDTGEAGAPRFLSMSLPVERVQRILEREVSLEPGMVAGIVDRDGTFVARTPDSTGSAGRTSTNRAAGTGTQFGTVWGHDADGVESLLAYRWSEVAGWRVGISVPKAVLDAPLDRALRTMAAAGAAALLLSILFALRVGRRLTAAARALTAAGDALRAGAPVPVPATGLREADEVGAALASAAADLQARADALRDSNERFRVALLGAPLIAYTCDRELRYTWIANPHRDTRSEGLLGRRDDELHELGRKPEEAEAANALKCEVIETGRGARRDLTWTGLDGVVNHYDVIAEPLRDAGGAIIGATVAALDVTARVSAMEELREHEARQRLLINELNHRVKNTLAAVQSIAMQTLRNADGTEEARKLLQRRLLALAAAHDVLTREAWEGAALQEVLATALAPHRPADPARMVLDGPPVWLAPRSALALSLAVHELATNAVKYGALSAGSDGCVAITWTLTPDRAFRLEWRESGGPPVAGTPARRGFGTRLIERGLAQDLGGTVRLDFARAGLVCIVETVLPQPGAAADAPPFVAEPATPYHFP